MNVLVLPHHTVTFSSCNRLANTSYGLLSAQCKQFFEFTLSVNAKCTSSVHIMRKDQLISSSQRVMNNQQNLAIIDCLSLPKFGLTGIETGPEQGAEFRGQLNLADSEHVKQHVHLRYKLYLQSYDIVFCNSFHRNGRSSTQKSIAYAISFFKFMNHVPYSFDSARASQ